MTKPLTEGKTRGQVKEEFSGVRPSAPPPSGVHTTNILPKSEREKQWKEFSDKLAKHLRDYTVPQYGDVGEDLITSYSVRDCVKEIERYVKRFGSQSREGQQEMDFLKIAHYAQCAWEKWNNLETEPEEDPHLLIVDERMDLYEEKGFIFMGSATTTGKTLYVYKKEQ